jgi:hypothetical protein
MTEYPTPNPDVGIDLGQKPQARERRGGCFISS